MQDIVKQAIKERKGTKATGARKGIPMTAPIAKRTYKASNKSDKAKAERAAYQREYRARMTEEQKEAARNRRNARERAIRKGQSYVYYPSIPQARDRRRSGDLLQAYYDEVTARLAISDANLVAMAHDQREIAIDEALQLARRPQPHREVWELRSPVEKQPMITYLNAPQAVLTKEQQKRIPMLIIQPRVPKRGYRRIWQ